MDALCSNCGKVVHATIELDNATLCEECYAKASSGKCLKCGARLEEDKSADGLCLECLRDREAELEADALERYYGPMSDEMAEILKQYHEDKGILDIAKEIALVSNANSMISKEGAKAYLDAYVRSLVLYYGMSEKDYNDNKNSIEVISERNKAFILEFNKFRMNVIGRPIEDNVEIIDHEGKVIMYQLV